MGMRSVARADRGTAARRSRSATRSFAGWNVVGERAMAPYARGACARYPRAGVRRWASSACLILALVVAVAAGVNRLTEPTYRSPLDRGYVTANYRVASD